MNDKIDTKKLKDAIQQVSAGLPSMPSLGDANVRIIGVNKHHLDTIIAAARTLLPPVLEYWRVEGTNSGKFVWSAAYPTQQQAQEYVDRIGQDCRITGPHTWEIEP